MIKTMHLFAGVGGGILCDLILGHTPVVAVEWDGYACQVLRERAADGWFPGLRVWEGDVRLFNPSEYAGIVDCIHAGFPCQPFSVAGKREGSQDERGEMFAEVVRCIEAIRPKQVFLENVPGLLTSKSPSCVCGWPYRRGGLFKDTSPIQENNVHIHSNCADEHVKQSSSYRGANGGDIWGGIVRGEINESEMVGSMAVAHQRGCSQQLREANSPIFDAEAKAGEFDSEASCAEGISTDSEEWDESLDARSKGLSSSDKGGNAHTESEGANCPNCGRGMVRDESRFVWYMESILWTMAALGYDSEWLCIRASDCGANHHRDRWFLLANSNLQHGQRGSQPQQPQRNGGEARVEHSRSGSNVADTDSAQRQRNERTQRSEQEYTDTSGPGWWEVESLVGRVADDVSNRVHRLKGLGNAQVPLQAAVAYRLLNG